jgi:hypothetical protein
MSPVILDLCTRDKTDEQIKQLNGDVDEFAKRGLRALAVAIEDLPNEQIDGKGNGFKLIGLLPIYDPPREDTKETIERALQLGKKNFKKKILKFIESNRCESENVNRRSISYCERNCTTSWNG